MSRAHFLGLNRVFSLVVLAILFQVLFHSGNKFFSCFWRDPTLVPYVDFENVSKFMTFWFALAKPPLKNSRLSSTTNRCDWHFAQHFDIETFSANICRTNSRDKARSLLLHRLAIFNWRSRDNHTDEKWQSSAGCWFSTCLLLLMIVALRTEICIT